MNTHFSRRSLALGASAAAFAPRFAFAQATFGLDLFKVILEAGTAFYLEKLFDVLVKPVALAEAENTSGSQDTFENHRGRQWRKKHHLQERSDFAWSDYVMSYDEDNIGYEDRSYSYTGETAIDAINAHSLHRTALKFKKEYPSIDDFKHLDALYPVADVSPFDSDGQQAWPHHARLYSTKVGKLRVVVQPELRMCQSTLFAGDSKIDVMVDLRVG